MVAVGSHSWTEAHDMNKALNRTCALEVLPDYPQYTNGNSSGVAGLSYPAGGLVSGRPFFCGGKMGHPWTNWPFHIRPECYTLKNNNWVFVANLATARYKHGGVSLGDSLWVTGKAKQKQEIKIKKVNAQIFPIFQPITALLCNLELERSVVKC